jgi:4-hydroxybenzoate polyprenyltransferase
MESTQAQASGQGEAKPSLGTKAKALASIPRYRNRPYNLIPFIIAFLASGNTNNIYLVQGLIAIFLYSFVQDYSNISGDRIEDAVNRPNRGVLARQAGGYSVVFWASIVSLALFAVNAVGMVLWGDLHWVWAATWMFGAALAMTYSYGPRTKASTWSSPIAHSFIPSLPLLLGWVGAGDVLVILPYFVLLTVMRFSNNGLGFKDIDDLEGDRRVGYRSVYLRYIESDRPAAKAMPILLAPFVLLAVLGLAGQFNDHWPIAFVMLLAAFPWLRILLNSRSRAEGIGVRELGNFYQLIWISIMCYDLYPQVETVVIAILGLVWYSLFTIYFYADKNELSRETLGAAFRVLRTGQSERSA